MDREVKIPALGEHMIYPALIAAAVGERFGLTPDQIEKGIGQFVPTRMRMNILHRREGITILDAMQYEQYLRATERQIEEAVEILERLRAEAEAKRLEVVEAKKDTSSIEKLREKKLDSYNKAVQKSEELIIEEFVTTTRVMAAQGAYA